MSGVQSIERAFTLMRSLAIGPAGVTELSERAELPKSTVARLLSALVEEGAVDQTENGGDYRLGSGLIDLAGAASPGRNLVASARPHLLDLTEQTGEASGLSVIEDNTVRYIDHVESEEEVQVRDWTGDVIPLHLVPSGIVLLASQPAEFVDNYLSNKLEKSTERSVTDPAVIRERLTDVATAGCFWFFTEYDDSINSVAAPVTDADGSVIAALHIQGPAYRFPDPDGAEAVSKLLKTAAKNLSVQLR